MSNKTDYKTFSHAFREISKLMHTSRSLREVQQRTVWKATELLKAKGALLRILNPETEQFEVVAAYGLGEWYLKKGPVSTQKILSDLKGTDQVVVIEDIWHDPRVQYRIKKFPAVLSSSGYSVEELKTSKIRNCNANIQAS